MATKPNEPTTTVRLSAWERDKLASLAGGAAFTFTSAYSTNGVQFGQMAEMNRWRSLAAKLQGEPEPEPLRYRGTKSNSFRADVF